MIHLKQTDKALHARIIKAENKKKKQHERMLLAMSVLPRKPSFDLMHHKIEAAMVFLSDNASCKLNYVQAPPC